MINVQECQTLVTRADTLANVELYLNNHHDQYHWLCCQHSNPDKEGCYGVKEDHHHWIIWNECVQRFIDSGLISFLKREDNKWRRDKPMENSHNNRFFSHKRVKNLQTMLIYFSEESMEIQWQRSKVPDEIKVLLRTIKNSKKK